MQDSSAKFYKTKHVNVSMWISSHAPWFSSKEPENLYSHKSLRTDVFSSFIHDCENLEATNMSWFLMKINFKKIILRLLKS